MQRMGEDFALPDIEAGAYLIDALMEAGPTLAHPMGGEMPLDWPTVAAYGQVMQTVSDPWEYKALIDMSRAYLAARIAGKSPLAMPPIEQE